MDPVTLGLTILAGLTAAGIFLYKKCLAERRKNDDILALTQALERYASQVTLEEVDVPIVNAVRDVLDRTCSPSVEERVKDMDLTERRQFFQGLIQDVAKEMQVDLKSISFRDLDPGYLGCCRNEGFDIHIVISDALIMADPKRAVVTICHELRHAQQFTSFTDDKWGFSDRRKAQWLSEFSSDASEHNTDSESQYRVYRCMTIELDANNFAAAATKDLK